MNDEATAFDRWYAAARRTGQIESDDRNGAIAGWQAAMAHAEGKVKAIACLPLQDGSPGIPRDECLDAFRREREG